MDQFPCILIHAGDWIELKFSQPTNFLGASPSLINLWLCSDEFQPLICGAFSAHFQKSCWSDWVWIWQTHRGPPPTWLTFIHAPLNFRCFLDSWLFEQFLPICRYTTDQIELKFSGSAHYGPLQAWLTGHATQNSCYFLASYWSSSFSPFADRIELKFGIPTHYRPPLANSWSCSTESVPLVSWPLIGWTVSLYLQGGGWGCEVSCDGHHRQRGKTTTGSALDGAVLDFTQILAYLVHSMSRFKLY